MEDDFPVRDDDEGKKGSVLTAWIGWESLEKNEEFKGTEVFKKNWTGVEGIEGVMKKVVFHLGCVKIEKVERKGV